MRSVSLILGLLLLVSSISQADENAVYRPKQLTNRSCYLYLPSYNSPNQPELTEFFTLDKNLNLRFKGTPAQFVAGGRVLSTSQLTEKENEDVWLTIQSLTGETLMEGKMSSKLYTPKYPGSSHSQSAEGAWVFGHLYNYPNNGEILCAPTSYGLPQRYPKTEIALQFLTSKSVPRELAKYVDNNISEVREILDRRSTLETYGAETGETVSDQITLVGSRDEEYVNCEKAYKLRFNIFTKKFSFSRGINCPDTNM